MMGRQAFVETPLACQVHQVWGCMRWQPLHPKIQQEEKIGLVKLRLEILTFAWCWLIVKSFFRISRLDTWAQVSLMHFLSCFSARLAWELLNIEVVCKISVFFWVERKSKWPRVYHTFFFRVFDLKSPQIQRQSYLELAPPIKSAKMVFLHIIPTKVCTSTCDNVPFLALNLVNFFQYDWKSAVNPHNRWQRLWFALLALLLITAFHLVVHVSAPCFSNLLLKWSQFYVSSFLATLTNQVAPSSLACASTTNQPPTTEIQIYCMLYSFSWLQCSKVFCLSSTTGTQI